MHMFIFSDHATFQFLFPSVHYYLRSYTHKRILCSTVQVFVRSLSVCALRFLFILGHSKLAFVSVHQSNYFAVLLHCSKLTCVYNVQSFLKTLSYIALYSPIFAFVVFIYLKHHTFSLLSAQVKWSMMRTQLTKRTEGPRDWSWVRLIYLLKEHYLSFRLLRDKTGQLFHEITWPWLGPTSDHLPRHFMLTICLIQDHCSKVQTI